MRFLRRLARWLRFRSHASDLAEELAFHREAIERDLVARGHTPAEARDAARRAMGNETMAREDARGIWLWPRLEALWQDATVTVLGAAASDVIRLVVGQGLRFAVTGAAVGGTIAILAAPRIAPLLFNQSPRDPVVFGAVTGALLLVAVVASMIPASRAARVDPNAALRAE
jgi:hypothetical protein